MSSQVALTRDDLVVEHRLKTGGREHRLTIKAAGPAHTPSEDSEAHFFKEHSWGFGRTRSGRLLTYEVQHPVWATYRVEDVELNWDWGAVYGPDWADYNDREPRSVYLAHGSAIAVAPKRVEN